MNPIYNVCGFMKNVSEKMKYLTFLEQYSTCEQKSDAENGTSECVRPCVTQGKNGTLRWKAAEYLAAFVAANLMQQTHILQLSSLAEEEELLRTWCSKQNTPVIIVSGDNGSICRVTFVPKDWYRLGFSTSESGRDECWLHS